MFAWSPATLPNRVIMRCKCKFSDSKRKMEPLTAVHNRVMMYGKESCMNQTKLTIRLSQDLLEGAKRYARENNTSLTRLVSVYLRQLADQGDPLADAPIVQRLAGTLSEDLSIQDYREYLEKKYGSKA
jgi:hypothetical protein